MAFKFKALVFDLGGVLLEWDRQRVNALSPGQFLTIMNSRTWHCLDRGNITLKGACKEFGDILNVNPSIVETAMDQARLSLRPNVPLIQTIRDIKASDPDLGLYLMSNISKEHFEMVQSIDLPWSLFDKAFASGLEGMRKPDLCFYQHVVQEIKVHPSEIIMIDDTPENVCAARSQGMHAILVDKLTRSVGGTLLNLLQDPVQRAKVFLKNNARNHDCIVEGHEETRLKDNFAQLMIWELIGDEDIIYLKWPNGRIHGIHSSGNNYQNGHSKDQPNGYRNGHTNYQPNVYLNGHSRDYPNDHVDGDAAVTSNVKNGLWNYFFEAPLWTTRDFPPDADTTSTAYLSVPKRYISTVPDVLLVLEKMITNLDQDGIMQTYFDPTRPRTTPEVCCNILRVFHKFGFGSDPHIKKTEDYVVNCLNHNACLNGNRHYSTPESFLYFVARLYAETRCELLRKRLNAITTQLEERLSVPTNPLALAFRLFACQSVNIDPQLYRKDLELLRSLQDEDGGWPAGHFCCFGRTGARIGNRGLTTALAVRILEQERRDA